MRRVAFGRAQGRSTGQTDPQEQRSSGRREPLRLEASGEAALLCAALPPIIQRMAGSWRRRSASFTSSYPASDRLPEQPSQCVPTILATARIGQHITRHLGQPNTSSSSRQAATEHRRSPASRETRASSGGRNPAEASDPDSPLGCAMAASLDPG